VVLDLFLLSCDAHDSLFLIKLIIQSDFSLLFYVLMGFVCLFLLRLTPDFRKVVV